MFDLFVARTASGYNYTWMAVTFYILYHFDQFRVDWEFSVYNEIVLTVTGYIIIIQTSGL